MKVLKILSKKTKIAISLSLVALMAALVGCFILKSEMRIVCWSCLIVVWVINYLTVIEDNIKLGEEQFVKDYEIDSLKCSYREMGRYINGLQIDELSDIDLRIENELKDIDIKKSWFEERLRK